MRPIILATMTAATSILVFACDGNSPHPDAGSGAGGSGGTSLVDISHVARLEMLWASSADAGEVVVAGRVGARHGELAVLGLPLADCGRRPHHHDHVQVRSAGRPPRLWLLLEHDARCPGRGDQTNRLHLHREQPPRARPVSGQPRTRPARADVGDGASDFQSGPYLCRT